MTQALLLNKPSHQPKIVKSTILWLAELRELEKADTESPQYGKLNKTKARISWKHFSLFHFIYLFSWEATYVLRHVHEGHESQLSPSTTWVLRIKWTWAVRGVHSKSFHPLSPLGDPCNVRNFIPTIGVKFQSSVCVCVCDQRATCMGSGTHATTNLQRSEDNLWGSVHSVPPGLREVSHHYASQTSWPSSLGSVQPLPPPLLQGTGIVSTLCYISSF